MTRPEKVKGLWPRSCLSSDQPQTPFPFSWTNGMLLPLLRIYSLTNSEPWLVSTSSYLSLPPTSSLVGSAWKTLCQENSMSRKVKDASEIFRSSVCVNVSDW